MVSHLCLSLTLSHASKKTPSHFNTSRSSTFLFLNISKSYPILFYVKAIVDISLAAMDFFELSQLTHFCIVCVDSSNTQATPPIVGLTDGNRAEARTTI